MNSARTIAVVGVSDEESAHLRLLLRRSAPDLDHPWIWGGETGADLVVVDPKSFAGQMARTRALGAGVRCAIFADEPVEGADLLLQRPLLRANVVAVLNTAASGRVRAADIGANTADFYTRDLGDAGNPAESAEAPVGEPTDRPTPVSGLDEVLRPQPVELRTSDWKPAPGRPHAAPAVPAPRESSSPMPAAAGAPPNTGVSRKYATRDAMLADTTPHGLLAYLETDLLRGPARFALPGAAPLVLDPKNRIVHAAAGLSTLEPYCRAQWRLCDWQPLIGADLAQLRAAQSTHSYARLIWLYVLLHSGGQLARHLDPGGSYRLKHWVEMDRELSRYFRIGSAMLQPARLHEIAAASGACMSDVFDVVNAYDAIGLIEWQPRPPRAGGEAAPSLLQRLRKPFGKS